MTQKPVRVLYLVPSDVHSSPAYVAAINSAMLDLQKWFSAQLGGWTFSPSVAQTLRLPNTTESYAVDSWNKIIADCPMLLETDKIWAVYADVVHACDAPGRLGAGHAGLCIMPRQDMDGLCGRPVFDDCGKSQTFSPARYVGGLGHELGHAFGLPHPPGCDTPDISGCDYDALMWSGFYKYPNCYLTATDKAALLKHPAFMEDAPTFPGYKEIDFSQPQWKDLDLDFKFKVVGGELDCEVFDKGVRVDFTKDELRKWIWELTARGGKLRPRSFDRIEEP